MSGQRTAQGRSGPGRPGRGRPGKGQPGEGTPAGAIQRPGGRLGDAEAEAALLACLRDPRLASWSFYRQHDLNPFVVDFFCPAAGLVVELDGRSEPGRSGYELRRREVLEAAGYRVHWVDRKAVLERPGAVVERLAILLDELHG
jgi:adenine-specific DNA-methyltransferase